MIKIRQNIYFLGIGGIGMSAIARYFKHIGKAVSGYDLTKTELTEQLQNEGINISYTEQNNSKLSEKFNKDSTLIIYTPAIPKENKELVYFRNNNFKILKRAQILGLLTKEQPTIAIAGTHGKTTVTSIIAHILKQNNTISAGFVGGITKNYNSNLILSDTLIPMSRRDKDLLTSRRDLVTSKYIVIEADEYDKSFLNFEPKHTLITSIDKDHLDIYENEQNLLNTFEKFVSQTKNTGTVILNNKVKLKINNETLKYIYSLNEKTDFYAKNIRNIDHFYTIDLVTPDYIIENVKTQIPGLINIENIVAATALAYVAKVPKEIIKKAIETYEGVKRRFDIQLITDKIIYIDDYAHHPEEIKALVSSVRKMFPNKKITGIFQPHLFSRTNDFAEEFAESLELLDELILTEIYPAREKPIKGVSSKNIYNFVGAIKKTLCRKQDLLQITENKEIEVLITIGAGDIDKEVEKINKLLSEKLRDKS